MPNYLRTSILYTLFVANTTYANIAGYLSTMIGRMNYDYNDTNTLLTKKSSDSRPPCTLICLVTLSRYMCDTQVVAERLARAYATIIPAFGGRSLANSYRHCSSVTCFNWCNAAGGCHGDVMAWASYQIRKTACCACAGNAGNVSPHRRLQRKSLVSDPGMHRGTCVTRVPWCMSGSLTRGGGENVPGIPGACAPTILRIWQEAHASSFCITGHFYGNPTVPTHKG